MILRRLEAADAAPVAALVREAFAHQSVATDPPSSALGETAANLAAILAAGGGAGVFGGAAPHAAVVWQPKPPGLYLSRLAVRPLERRRGLARALLAEAERAARADGHAVLWLSTRLVLADNRNLFTACGFMEGARHAHPGYAAPTFVEMLKPLR